VLGRIWLADMVSRSGLMQHSFPGSTAIKHPLAMRVAADEAVEMELADAEKLKKWKQFYSGKIVPLF